MIKMIEEIKGNKNQLPKDWKWVKVGEYVISVKGKKPKRISKEKTKECSIPYVNIKAFEKKIIDEYTDGVGCALCEDGDFLMVWDGSRSGYVGKAIKGALGSTLVKLNFPDIENNYAYYFLQSKFIEINTRAKGVGIPHVDPNILWNYDLLIPPKPTQQAIVSKIEELFSELDKGIEQLKTAQQQLKTYRQSVLKWAFEGKLTRSLNHDSYSLHDEHDFSIAAENKAEYKIKKNQDNQNNHTNHSSDKGELPEDWKWKRLGDMFDFVGGGTPSKSEKDYWNGNIFWASVKDVKGNYLNKTQDTITEKGLKNSASNLAEPGDVILITRISPGKSIISNVKSAINQDLKIAKPKFKATPKFINYFFNAIERECVKIASGTTVLGITLNNLNELEIPDLNIKEQNNIVQEIESCLSVADKMEESITQSLQQAEALKQSILKKAFEGRLIE
jgi:type I restriction enzyme, S subunit